MPNYFNSKNVPNSIIENSVFKNNNVSNNAVISFQDCTFGNEYFSIDCYSSYITLINSKNLNPFYICNFCNSLYVESQVICKKSSTTSTLHFDSNSSHSSDSLILIANYSVSIIFLIFDLFFYYN
ncbi:hypothetical protein ACTFIR_008994 [Dictyostelium discoideum]